MRYSLPSSVILLLALVGCEYDATGTSSAALGTPTDRCEIFGAGSIPTGDSFDGSARGGEGGTVGTWTNEAGGVVTLGEADWIVCRINGVLLGDLGGPATFNGASGYQFLVSVQDFGDPTASRRGATQTQTITATRYYSPSRWEDGEVSIEDHAIVTIPSELPVIVGNAGNQWAWLQFERADNGDTVTCRYRGGASRSCPRDAGDLSDGLSYELERCTGDGSDPVVAGDRVDVNWMTLRVVSGAHNLPTVETAQTTVSVDLQVAQVLPPQGDFYHVVVGDELGNTVYETEGFLDSGDLTVRYLQ